MSTFQIISVPGILAIAPSISENDKHVSSTCSSSTMKYGEATGILSRKLNENIVVYSNNNRPNNDNIYGAVIVAQRHCESSAGSCDEYGTAPSGRRPSDQANRPGMGVRLI